MANTKKTESKETEKKKTTKPATSTNKKTSSSSKTNTSKPATKKTSSTNASSKSTTTKSTTAKKTTSKKSSTTKNSSTTKKTTKTTPKVTAKIEVENKEPKVLETVVLDEKVNNSLKNENTITKQEKVEKEIIEEINNVNTTKLEDAKFQTTKKNKHLLGIGIIIVVLGIIALIVALIANRIVDREFLSDSAITLMMVASIIIEGFGAFIIINET